MNLNVLNDLCGLAIFLSYLQSHATGRGTFDNIINVGGFFEQIYVGGVFDSIDAGGFFDSIDVSDTFKSK